MPSFVVPRGDGISRSDPFPADGAGALAGAFLAGRLAGPSALAAVSTLAAVAGADFLAGCFAAGFFVAAIEASTSQ